MNYEEALEKAKERYLKIKDIDSSEKSFLLEIFPELVESEDEKIRKEIIKHLVSLNNGCYKRPSEDIIDNWIAWLEKQCDKYNYPNLPKFTFDDVLALQCCMETVKKVIEDKTLYEQLRSLHDRVHDAYHLEKQDEQEEPQVYETEDGEVITYSETDGYKVVEPKFKVGDCVIDKQGIVHQIERVVENVTNHTFGYDIVGGGYFNDSIEGVRLWTIEDAKAGDVLVDIDNNILIYEEPSTTTHYHSYCYYDGQLGSFIASGGSHIIKSTKPATKEQRDLLFQKMKEAGYKWDDKKKEIYKVVIDEGKSEIDRNFTEMMFGEKSPLGVKRMKNI